MKRLLVILTVALFAIESGYAAKNVTSREAAEKELKARVDKESRKSAKSMTKAGWQSMPGRVSLEKQIERSKIAELSVDENDNNIYILGTHRATGGNYSAAKNIATTRAKGELASNIQTNVKRTIMDKNSNKQLADGAIELMDETISAALESIDLDLIGVNNVMEIFRDVDGGKCEIMITLSVKAQQVIDAVVNKVGEDLPEDAGFVVK